MDKKVKNDIKGVFQDDYEKLQQIVAQLPETLQTAIGNYEDKEKLKKALQEQSNHYAEIQKQLKEHPDTCMVEYVSEPLGASRYGMYNPSTNILEINSDYENTYHGKDTQLHELHHKYVHHTQTITLPMNLEQKSLISKHDEISANLASLVGVRQEYKMAKTDEERAQILQNMREASYGFYADAIEKGEVNPLSDSPEDFKKEMEFMFHGTQKMWMEKFDKIYISQVSAQCSTHFNTHSYDELKKNDENYNLAREKIYHIAGFDFSQFKDDESVKCTDEHTLWQDKAIAAGAKRNYVQDPYQFKPLVFVQEPLEKEISTPEVRDDMSLEQQYQLQIYRTLVDVYKKEHADELEKLGDKVNAKNLKRSVESETRIIALNMRAEYQHQAITVFSEKLINSGKNPKANDAKFKEELEKICTINGVNVLKDINKSEAIEIIIRNENDSFLGVDEKFSMNKFLKDIDKQPSYIKDDILKKIQSDSKSFKGNYQEYLEECEKRKIEAKRIRSLPFDGHEGSEEDKKATDQSRDYYGKPKYYEGANVKKSEVLDLTKSSLQQELLSKEMKSAADMALNQVNAMDAVAQVRANIEQKKQEKNPPKQEKNPPIKSEQTITSVLPSKNAIEK